MTSLNPKIQSGSGLEINTTLVTGVVLEKQTY